MLANGICLFSDFVICLCFFLKISDSNFAIFEWSSNCWLKFLFAIYDNFICGKWLCMIEIVFFWWLAADCFCYVLLFLLLFLQKW